MAFLEFVDFVPKVAAAAEEVVKPTAEATLAKRDRATERLRLRKNVRRIQSTSRREARA